MPEYVNQNGRRMGALPGSALEDRLIRDGWWVDGSGRPAPERADSSELDAANARIEHLEREMKALAEGGGGDEPQSALVDALEARLSTAQDRIVELEAEVERLTPSDDPPAAPPAPAGAGDEPPADGLDEQSRADIDGILAGLGLDPAAYRNKTQAIAAIREAREEVSNG